MTDFIARRVSEALGREATGTSRVSGGDVAQAFQVRFVDGSVVFAKTHAAPPPGFFRTEAAGLAWLRAASGPDDLLAIPEVLAVADDLLVLSWIEESRSARGDRVESDFGRGLARMHRRSQSESVVDFGRADRATTGSRALPNEPTASWPEFFATQRLVPLARLASTEQALSQRSVARLEAVSQRLSAVGAADEPAVLLHGDLWAGNRLVDASGTNWLIDPASHGSHREFDLAMMSLFGGFGEECFESYHDEFPLSDGWRDRVPLHQLAPLTVHAIKFGGGYASAVDRALDAAERLV